MRYISLLISIEGILFIVSALAHLGIKVLGLNESPVMSEAVVQGVIGVALFICAFALSKNIKWSRSASIAVHILALSGALFGLLVVQEKDNHLGFYNILRLSLIAIVLVSLTLPRSRRE